MGKEAECEAKVDGRADGGLALLESTALIFRGKKLKRTVKLDATPSLRKEAKTHGPWLTVGALSLKLGVATAKTWLDAIANPKSVFTKLALQPDQPALISGEVPDALRPMLREHGVNVVRAPTDHCVFFVGVSRLAQLSKLPTLGPKNVLWLLRVKGKDAAVSEAASRQAARDAGLVDVKVVSFSSTHSAEKYVRRNSTP